MRPADDGPSLRLIRRHWWDDGDPEHLVYYQITAGSRVVWESYWRDVRDLGDDTGEVGLFRGEVVAAMLEHGLNPALADGDWADWG